MNKIICVVPTIRPQSHAQFVKAWTPLFEKHKVTLLTVWDGDKPTYTMNSYDHEGLTSGDGYGSVLDYEPFKSHRDLFCRHTDAVRNLGFVAAAQLNPTHVLTLDDDVEPLGAHLNSWERNNFDPIQSHLDALDRRVSLSWMNTAHDTDLYLRGVPYNTRTEAPVMLSHGVWVGTPDFDGETQLRLEKTCRDCGGEGKLLDVPQYRCGRCNGSGKEGIPHSLPYYVGPIPRGVNAAICGMNVMVKRDALPYLYYAPMGVDSGVPDLHRFGDIFMGCAVRQEFDEREWGIVTGYSTIFHTRASDAKKNYEAEKLGRQWMEKMPLLLDNFESLGGGSNTDCTRYFRSYSDKRTRYADLITTILEKNHVPHE